MKRWDVILRLLPEDVPLRGAEVGVWRGDTSERLLANRPLLHLFMVDRWKPPSEDDSYYGSGSKIATWPDQKHRQAREMAKKRVRSFGERASVLIGESVEIASMFEDESLDFVFIDGDHSYQGVTRDLHAWVPKVRPTGLVIGHDIDRPDKGQVTDAVYDVIGNHIHREDAHVWWIERNRIR